MAHDVFISHSTRDKPVSDAVCAALENAGIRCWVAPRDVQPGRSFAGEITRAIQQSKAMVLIFSANSNASEQVLREVQLAVEAKLHILQFRIEEVLLNDDLKYYLSTPHWLDALTPPLENHLDRLSTAIKALLGKPEAKPGTSSAEPAVRKEIEARVPSPGATQPAPVSAALTPANASRRSFWIRGLVAAVLIGGIALVATTWRHNEPPPAVPVTPATRDPQAVIRINFDDLPPGFLEPAALASRGVRFLRTSGGKAAINDADPGMVLTPGHSRVLNVRGGNPQTSLIFEFDPPIKKFTLARIGGNPTSLPTWMLEARDASGRIVDSLSQMRGDTSEPRIREPAFFTVSASSISSVAVIVDNRNGNGTWATYNCLPIVEIEFQR